MKLHITVYNQLKTSQGVEVKIFPKKKLQAQNEKEICRKTKGKQSSHKNIQYSSHLLPFILPYKIISWISRKSKCQIVYFFPVSNIVETAMEAFPLQLI